MAVHPIRITGDDALHSPAAPVTEFDDELRGLVADMFETMDAAPGVGLAAPQIGVPLRIFTYTWVEDSGEQVRGVAINPTLWITPVPAGIADEETESEGCLSFPGERFGLRRADRAILQAVDVDGEPYEIRAEGWLARIFQHEFDHLEGVLYTDRLDWHDQKIVAKLTRKRGWGVPGNAWMPGVDNLDA
ncbi:MULTISPECIES: peptide deformylase [unclassified Leifsonia]|uniref:peptide deformylase n=1 Tax=unclassified Leifsonia TaxID=2663824 RepID=UPI0006F2DCBA|nr:MULTISPECIES: peptide deformylase [unclassified Leifsonia]KQX07065.1 peptide deformylase [Leifsonia sp. Root1293]KRA11348.1 peptide deformylase [Leifsonia sp. Root60]